MGQAALAKTDRGIELKQGDRMQNVLAANAHKLAEISAGFMTAERMIQYALTARSQNGYLAKSTPASVFRALLDAARLQIEPGGLNGRGYLVPRRNKDGKWECHFDPGYRGLIDIARRSGEIDTFSAVLVHEGDEFEYYFDPEPQLRHRPTLDSANRGAIVAAYAVVKLKSGSRQIEVMLKEDLDRIKDISAAKNGPWRSHYGEMCRKTVIRRVCKYLPTGKLLDYAMALSDGADMGERSPMVDVETVADTTSVVGQLGAGDDQGEPEDFDEEMPAVEGDEIEGLAESVNEPDPGVNEDGSPR